MTCFPVAGTGPHGIKSTQNMSSCAEVSTGVKSWVKLNRSFNEIIYFSSVSLNSSCRSYKFSYDKLLAVLSTNSMMSVNWKLAFRKPSIAFSCVFWLLNGYWDCCMCRFQTLHLQLLSEPKCWTYCMYGEGKSVHIWKECLHLIPKMFVPVVKCICMADSWLNYTVETRNVETE